MRKKSILIAIVLGIVHYYGSAQYDSTKSEKKVVGDSVLFRSNVLPQFQNDTLFESIKDYISKQQAIVYTITGYSYKKGLVVILITDSVGKVIKGASFYKSGELIRIPPIYTNLSKGVIRRVNRRRYNTLERWKFESWTLGSTIPIEELIYKVEDETIISAILLIDVPPGYFAFSKLEISFLYQFRDELHNQLYRIEKAIR
jgi:hypothetical protein